MHAAEEPEAALRIGFGHRSPWEMKKSQRNTYEEFHSLSNGSWLPGPRCSWKMLRNSNSSSEGDVAGASGSWSGDCHIRPYSGLVGVF